MDARGADAVGYIYYSGVFFEGGEEREGDVCGGYVGEGEDGGGEGRREGEEEGEDGGGGWDAGCVHRGGGVHIVGR